MRGCESVKTHEVGARLDWTNTPDVSRERDTHTLAFALGKNAGKEGVGFEGESVKNCSVSSKRLAGWITECV